MKSRETCWEHVDSWLHWCLELDNREATLSLHGLNVAREGVLLVFVDEQQGLKQLCEPEPLIDSLHLITC